MGHWIHCPRNSEDVQNLYPVHLNPAVQEPVRRLLGQAHNVLLIEPQDYLPFVYLMTQAHLIITDSGTVRLVGTDEDKIVTEAERLLDDADAYQAMARALNPYGDGQAAMRIRSALEG